MKQSTIIFGTLLFAFLVYITVRGQLPAYMALFSSAKVTAATTGTPGTATQASPSPSFGASVSSFGQILSNLQQSSAVSTVGSLLSGIGKGL